MFEGALASVAPFASLPAPQGGYTAGPDNVALGRFAWASPVDGTVSNVATEGFPFGLAMQYRRNRIGEGQATFIVGGVRYLIAGKPITLAATGVFWVRFPQGASIGATVYADPATGIAYAADGGGFVPTKWKAITDAGVGSLGIISPYSQFG
jgi:hypothetical protein